MPTPQQRALAAFVQISQVTFGIPLWLWMWALHDNDYNVYFIMFFPGVFMLAAGLGISAIARIFSHKPFLRAQIGGTLVFHAILAVITVAIAAGLYVALAFTKSTGVVAVAFAFGIVLALTELGRAVFGLARAFARDDFGTRPS